MGTVAAALAALAAVGVVFAAWEDHEALLRRRLAAAPPGRSWRPRPRRWALPVAGVVVAVAASVGGGAGLTAGVVSVLVLGVFVDLTVRARTGRRALGAAADVVRAGEALAGTLRTGAIPATALGWLAPDHLVLAEAASAQAVGGDVAAALRRAATEPGRAGLADLAAAWEVSLRTGASLGLAIEAIAEELARRREVAATVTVELAASRMAGRLMALLPGAGVLLGYGLGGDPVAFLTASPAGWACLVVAVTLAGAGLEWTDRIAARAGR